MRSLEVADVNAIAPNAPMGATIMMIPTIRKSAFERTSNTFSAGRAVAQRAQRDAEQHGDEHHLQHLALDERLESMFAGTMCVTKSTNVICSAWLV